MVKLTAEKPGCALGMFKSTFQVESSQRFRYHHSTITRIQRGYQGRGTTRGCPCPGQQRVTTPRQDRNILHLHIHDGMLPGLHPLFRVNEGLSADRLCSYVEPILTDRHRNERQWWAMMNHVSIKEC